LCAAAGCCYCVYAAVCCSKEVVVDVDVVDVVDAPDEIELHGAAWS
jgi:hypothetical protein